jgi:predicted HTH transcriptional regulator
MMKEGGCLGCRTYFEEGERLPLLGVFTEFRNYELPVRDNRQRWGLLRTLTGFLNSRGGTIFIGVEESQGEVRGMALNRK